MTDAIDPSASDPSAGFGEIGDNFQEQKENLKVQLADIRAGQEQNNYYLELLTLVTGHLKDAAESAPENGEISYPGGEKDALVDDAFEALARQRNGLGPDDDVTPDMLNAVKAEFTSVNEEGVAVVDIKELSTEVSTQSAVLTSVSEDLLQEVQLLVGNLTNLNGAQVALIAAELGIEKTIVDKALSKT